MIINKVSIDVGSNSIDVKYPEKMFSIQTQRGTLDRNGISIRELIIACIEKLKASSDSSRPDPFTIASIGYLNLALSELTKRHYERRKHIVRREENTTPVASTNEEVKD